MFERAGPNCLTVLFEIGKSPNLTIVRPRFSEGYTSSFAVLAHTLRVNEGLIELSARVRASTLVDTWFTSTTAFWSKRAFCGSEFRFGARSRSFTPARRRSHLVADGSFRDLYDTWSSWSIRSMGPSSLAEQEAREVGAFFAGPGMVKRAGALGASSGCPPPMDHFRSPSRKPSDIAGTLAEVATQ